MKTYVRFEREKLVTRNWRSPPFGWFSSVAAAKKFAVSMRRAKICQLKAEIKKISAFKETS